jgi:carboxylesterase
MGEFLAAQGHTVLGVRLAGHGTNLEDFARSRWRDWVASTESGWQELDKQCSRVFVAGHSLGGLLGMYLSLGKPLAGLVVMSAPTHLPSNDWRLRFIGLFKHFIREQQVPPDLDDAADPTLRERIWHYDKICVPALHELTKFVAITRRRLPDVRVPILIMQGRRDRNVPLDSAEEIYQRVGSADKQVVWLPESGHVIPEDVERERVWQLTADFMRERVV